MATITWSGLGGDTSFNTPGNWIGDVPPGAGDFAVIPAGATVDAGSQTVDSLATATGAVVTIDGGNSFTMNNGSGAGANAGTIAIADNANLQVGGTVDNTGTISLDSTGDATRLILNSGTITLTGAGVVVMSDNPNNQIRGQGGQGGVTLLNLNNTISGAGVIGINEGSTSLVNRAVIDANSADNLLEIATGGGGTTQNTGTLESTAAGGLQLNGTLIDNTGSSNAGKIIAAGAGAHVDIVSATIKGGTLSTSGGGVIRAEDRNAVLDGSAAPVINSGTFQVPDNTDIQWLGTIDNTGTFQLASGGDTTRIMLNAGTVTLDGGGQVVMSDNPDNQIRGQGGLGGVTLLNIDNTISGAGFIGINEGSTSLINRAVIDANSADNLLEIATGGGGTSTQNTGTLEATSTGGLQLANTLIDNTGSNNAGLIVAAGAGAHVDILSATIKGGTLVTSGGGLIRAADYGGVLDGSAAPVNNTGTFQVPDNTDIQWLGTIDNTGTFQLASGGDQTRILLNAGTVTLDGGGSVVMSDSTANQIRGQGGVGGVTLLNVDNTISGAGYIGIGEGSTSLINRAVIDATSADNPLVIATGGGSTSTVNTGTLESTGAGGLQINSTLVDNTGTGAAGHANAGQIIAAGTAAHVDLISATIRGGTLSTSGGGVIRSGDRSSVLDGTTTGAPVVNAGNLQVADNTDLQLAGTLVNTGTLSIDSVGNLTRLMLNDDVTISGSGHVVMSDNPNNQIRGQGGIGGVTLTLSQNLSGAGVIGINEGSTGLINNALIDATGASQLIIETDTVGTTNNATLQASSTASTGGLYLYNTTIHNASGTIQAVANGAQVQLLSTTVDGGLLTTRNGGVIRSLDRGVVLDGTAGGIANSGSLVITDNTDINLLGTLTNTGTVLVDSAGDLTRLILASPTVVVAGAGTLELTDNANNQVRGNGGGTQTLDLRQNLSGAGDIGVNDGSTALINNALIDANSGDNRLFIETDTPGTTNNGTLQASGNSTLGGLYIYNTSISNALGTIQAVTNGAEVLLQSVTVHGGLLTTKNGGTFVTLDRSVLFDGAAGGITSAGSVVVTDNTDIDLTGTFTNTGTVALNSAGDLTRLVATSGTVNAAVTLTGGSAITMTDSPDNQIIGSPGGGGTQVLIDLDNVITGAGNIGVNDAALAFTNDTLVNATGTNALVLETAAAGIVNRGTIESTNSGGLFIYGTTVNNAGGTLSAAGPAGSAIRLQSATIEGGLLATSGGGVVDTLDRSVLLDGTASTLTTAGTVNVSDNTDLDLAGNIRNSGLINIASVGNLTRLVVNPTAVTLTGGGTIDLFGGPSEIIANGAVTTLDNVDNTIDGSGQIGQNDDLLNLTNSGLVNASQSTALTFVLGGTTITNTATGTLRGSGSGGLVIQNGTLANAGTVEALNGAAVTMQSGAVLTNNAGGTLTGGIWRAIATTGAAAVSLVGGNITTDAATIVLSGAGSTLQAGDGTSFATLDSTLATIAAAGTLQLLNGRNFTATAAQSDAGLLALGGVTFTAPSLAVAATGTVAGTGTLAATVTDAGLIDVTAAGKLKIAGTATGAGVQQIESGATLELGAANAVNVAFAGTLDSLILDAPASYTGTLSGLARGDTIELAGVVATTATIAAGSLTVNLSGGGSETYAITGGTDLREQVTVAGGNSFLTSYEKATASPHLPEPVTIAAQHVGGTLTQALTLTNTAPVSPFTENLDAAFGTLSSTVTAAGTINLLAPGTTDTTSLLVGVNTTSDGVKTGTAVLNLFTDGTGVDGLGPLAIPGQTVDVTGTVYALAAPALGTNELSGAARVGAVGALLAPPLMVSNGTLSIPSDPYKEAMTYVTGSPTGPFAVVSNGSGTLAAGGLTAVTLQVSTGTAGVFTGTAAIAFTSLGLGGLADTVLPQQTVGLEGKVYAPAVAQLSTTTLDLGNIHVGGGATASKTLTIANTATGALVDVLDGGFGTVPANFAGAGTLAGVTSGNSGTLTMAFNAGSLAAGAYTGTASLVLESHDADLPDASVSAGPVTLEAAVYALAAPAFSATTVNLGAARVGTAAPSASFTLSDGSSANTFQESLVYTAGTASAPFATVTNTAGTVAAGASATVGLQLNTGTAGTFSAGTLSVALTSTGAGTSGLADTTLTPQGIALTGKVYAAAIAQPATTTIDFGIVHVHDTASTTLSIANTATGALTDLLTGGFGAVSAGFTGTGALSVAAGSSGTLTLSMATGTAAVQSGTASLSLLSHDSDLADIAAAAGPVTLAGTVNNYATAGFAKVAGSGTLTGGGTSYTLDLGTITAGTVFAGVTISAANIATGPADLLGGSFAIAGDPAFTNAGFVTFTAVAAGAQSAPGSIGLFTATFGTFTETITLHSDGSNASGYSGALADETLTVDAVVACFAAGTRILTAQGEMNVEALRVGDRVPTLQGTRLARIVWIGHRRTDCTRHPRPADVWPVRIRANAFAPGAPHTDLVLSPDHALYIGNVLIPVRALVNGTTVVQEQAAEITYFHVELDRHDILLANGLPTETYLDTGNRISFANGGGALRAHPVFARQVWDAQGCAPLMVTGPDVADARRRLHAQSHAAAARRTG